MRDREKLWPCQSVIRFESRPELDRRKSLSSSHAFPYGITIGTTKFELSSRFVHGRRRSGPEKSRAAGSAISLNCLKKEKEWTVGEVGGR